MTVTAKKSGSNIMMYGDKNEQRGRYVLLCPTPPEVKNPSHYKVVVAFGCNLNDYSDEGTRAEVYGEYDLHTAASIATKFLGE